MKKQIIDTYTEEKYTMEQLVNMFYDLAVEARKKGYCVEFITQKPLLDEKGNPVYDSNNIPIITTDFPAEITIYKLVN